MLFPPDPAAEPYVHVEIPAEEYIHQASYVVCSDLKWVGGKVIAETILI